MLKAQNTLCLVARTLLRQPGLPAISQWVLVDDSLANMEPEDIFLPKESFRSGSHRDHSALLSFWSKAWDLPSAQTLAVCYWTYHPLFFLDTEYDKPGRAVSLALRTKGDLKKILGYRKTTFSFCQTTCLFTPGFSNNFRDLVYNP